MGKKAMKLPFLFKTKERKQHHPWQQLLPSCGQHPKTLSFRATTGDDIIKTVNSVFLDPTIEGTVETPPESWFTTTSSESARSVISTESEDYYNCYNHDGESLEVLVRDVVRSSERLFFEPNIGDTSSILEKAKASGFPFKESVVLAMESEDPYQDFRKSMEEMVESHGVKDWEDLEELLSWYLKVNGQKNHGFIVGAFVDLLISINSSSCSENSTTTTAYSSAVSSLASSPLLCISEGQQISEIVDQDEHGDCTVTTS